MATRASATAGGSISAPRPATRSAEVRAAEGGLTSGGVWRELAKQSFAVIAHVNDLGEPRSSGICYAMTDHRLYVAVAPDGWKARQIHSGDQVSVTVPVRRGGPLSLLFPIPPATITFHARATVHPPETVTRSSLPSQLRRLLPDTGTSPMCVIELAPEGRFMTYGIGVSLMAMRDPDAARAWVAVV